MFSELIKDQEYSFYVWMAQVFTINQNVVQIHNNKDVKMIDKDLVHIALKTDQSVRKFKKHNLVLKITVLSSKTGLLFVTFSNFYPIVGIGQDQLDEILSII